ncbi:MAG: hypothetical protein AAF645_23225 [Myxococcota bacterium]
MGYRYVAHVALSDAEVGPLSERVATARYVPVRSSPSSLALVFPEDRARSPWPEDVRVSFGRAICVTFHSASPAERSQFLRHLQRVLATLGHDLEFEAL